MNDIDHAHVRLPPPLVYLGMLFSGIAIDALAGWLGFGLSFAVRAVLGAVLIASGLAIMATAILKFTRASTSIKPWEPTTAIVDTGVYAWTRNPMYLSMAALYAGLALLLDSVVAMMLLPVAVVIIQTQVIAREERYLERKFGDPYRVYKKRVRRWI